MSSRDDILARIRRNQPTATPATAWDGPAIRYAHRETQFSEVLSFVGGQCIVASRSELNGVIAKLPCFDGAKQIVCTVPDLPIGNRDLSGIAGPHELADVDVAVLAGEFAVAENGAVWVTDRQIAHRAIYFIAQHVVLVVPREAIVDNLHQAYERLDFARPGYGLFISGPSKTADIEQSLVIGAHGPRSLTVILAD